MDRLTPECRSWLMSRGVSKDTSAELRLRSAVHARGLGLWVHRKDLPGRPDLVFPGWRTTVFVHECLWHRHGRCKKATTPKTRADFWREKFDRALMRDQANLAALRAAGWRAEVVWECETKSPEALRARLDDIFSKAVEP